MNPRDQLNVDNQSQTGTSKPSKRKRSETRDESLEALNRLTVKKNAGVKLSKEEQREYKNASNTIKERERRVIRKTKNELKLQEKESLLANKNDIEQKIIDMKDENEQLRHEIQCMRAFIVQQGEEDVLKKLHEYDAKQTDSSSYICQQLNILPQVSHVPYASSQLRKLQQDEKNLPSDVPLTTLNTDYFDHESRIFKKS